MSNLPKFSRALLHPRYWLLWLGIGFCGCWCYRIR